MKNESANLADFQDMPYLSNGPLNEKPLELLGRDRTIEEEHYEEHVRHHAHKMMEVIGDLGIEDDRAAIMRLLLFVLDHYPATDYPEGERGYLVWVKDGDLR